MAPRHFSAMQNVVIGRRYSELGAQPFASARAKVPPPNDGKLQIPIADLDPRSDIATCSPDPQSSKSANINSISSLATRP